MSARRFHRAGVIGGGAWGTALAEVCARAGLQVVLWAREPVVVEAVNATRRNPLFLPDAVLSEAISATGDLASLGACDLLLAVTPAQHLRATLRQLAGQGLTAPVVLCAKGVEAGSLKLMTEVLSETLPQAHAAVLSGPSFAIEVVRGLPTAVTLAAFDLALAESLAEAIATPSFRPYLSDDPIGAEAGGAVKNVLAIAAGIVAGRGLGQSAHAALVTRGFAELTRLTVALGGRAETVAGLCGLGDLILTCSSPTSRNFSLGRSLAQGQTAEEALAGRLSVAEGAASAPAVVALAARNGVEMPICEAVRAILAGETAVGEAITGLLARPLRAET